MAKFQKGVSGNPKGRPPLAPEVRRLREITAESYCQLLADLWNQTNEVLTELATSKTEQIAVSALASCLLKARVKGDYDTLEKMMIRLIGRVPDEVNIRSTNFNANTVRKVDKGELKDIIAEIRAEY